MAQGVRLDESVLPVDEFTALREKGLSFEAIGKRIGYSGGAVGAYAKRVLPERLWGRPGGRKRKSEKAEPRSPEEIRAELRKTAEAAAERARRRIAERKREKAKVPEQVVGGQTVAAAELTVEVLPERTVPTGTVFTVGPLHGPLVIAASRGVTDVQCLVETRGDWDAWHDFLFDTSPDLLKFKGLLDMTPPPYVRTDDDRLMYLRYVAAGRVWISGGWRVRRKLRRILAEIGCPVLSLKTVRLLDVLASAAVWLIKREV